MSWRLGLIRHLSNYRFSALVTRKNFVLHRRNFGGTYLDIVRSKSKNFDSVKKYLKVNFAWSFNYGLVCFIT